MQIESIAKALFEKKKDLANTYAYCML